MHNKIHYFHTNTISISLDICKYYTSLILRIYAVKSFVYGDMYRMPNVATTVVTTKIHKRSLKM